MKIRWKDAEVGSDSLENLIPLLRKHGMPLETDGCRLAVSVDGGIRAIVFHEPMTASMLGPACMQAAAQVMVELYARGFRAEKEEGVMHWVIDTDANLSDLRNIFFGLKEIGGQLVVNRRGWAVEIRTGR